jgi:pimeloyl-ACP methyl ester carboxylesterase
MRRAALLLLGFVFGAASLLADIRVPRASPCVAASADCHEPFTVAGQLTVGVYRTFALANPNPAITRAVVVVHGSSRNNDHYFKAVADSAVSAGVAGDVLVVAPGFRMLADKPPANELYWDKEDWWKSGGPSTAAFSPQVSSYEVMDRLLATLGDRTRFPNLRTIVVTGHSAGGQYVQRYAVGTQADGRLPGVEVKYVVANPSSYVYLNDQRPKAFTDQFWTPPQQPEPCPDYDTYKYGLNGRNDYMGRLEAAALTAAYRNRNVTYLLGASDADATDDGLDKRCGGMLQGRFRLERGINFKAHMDRFFAPHKHRIVLVPLIGHAGDRMYKSTEGQMVLFR